LAFLYYLIIVSVLMYDKRMKFFIPALVWAVIIFSVSSIPDLSAPSFGFGFIDKTAHFGEYFILGIFLAYAFASQNLKLMKVFWFSAFVSGLYGAADEFHQFFVPGRQMDGLDILADVIGAVSASGVYVLKIRKRGS